MNFIDIKEKVLESEQKITEHDASLSEIVHLEKSNLQNFFDETKANIILAGIDSLTNGAGDTKYLDYFSPRLRGELGDGGIGYCAFDIYSQDSVENFSIGYGGMSNLSATPESTDAHHKYSFDLKGVYCTNGTGVEYVNIEIKRKFKHSKIIYLKQPGGGSFDIKYNGDTIVNVNTANDTYDLGVLDMPSKDYFVLSGWGNALLNISNIIGNVCIYGGIFTNDTGICVSPIGRGGNKLSWHNSLDKTMFAKWLTILQPKMFIFNGGTNDDISSDFSGMLSSYLQPYINASCNITLIRPHQMSSDTKWSTWEPILTAYAEQNHLDYISEKYLLGSTYTEAITNGYMLDTTHPSILGNTKRANNLLQHLGIPILGNDITNYVSAVPVPTTKTYTTNLTNKIISGHATNLPDSTIYTLGLRNVYGGIKPKGMIELKIYAQIDGADGSNIKIRRIVFPIWNLNSTDNQAQSDNTKLVSTIEYDNATTNFDFVVSVSNTDNRVVVNLHTNYIGWVNYNIVGTAYITLVNVNGVAIYEN